MDDEFSFEIVVILKSALEDIKKEAEDASKNLEVAMGALYEIGYPSYFDAQDALKLARDAIEKIEKK